MTVYDDVGAGGEDAGVWEVPVNETLVTASDASADGGGDSDLAELITPAAVTGTPSGLISQMSETPSCVVQSPGHSIRALMPATSGKKPRGQTSIRGYPLFNTVTQQVMSNLEIEFRVYIRYV